MLPSCSAHPPPPSQVTVLHLGLQVYILALHPLSQTCDPRLHLQDLPLLWRDPAQTLHHQPAALIVLDVGANLPCQCWVPIAVQVIILCDSGDT